MPSPIEARVWDLCARLASTQDEAEIERLLPELKAATAEYIQNIRTMEEALGAFSADRRFNTLLMGIFALCAVVLAAVGILGVVSYSVSRRTKEIGVRMALGAKRADVLWLILGQLIIPVSVGIAIGVAVAASATRVLRGFLFGVSPLDPITFCTAIIFVATLGYLAGLGPARRASRVDPMVALRYE